MPNTLYVVATPIGNLEDITLRAIRILKEVDVVFAEDTREAYKLLSHFDVDTKIERYDEHSHGSQISNIIGYLKDGKNIAYISDAGTPGISDPGKRLVCSVRESLAGIDIVPVPGPSAVVSLLSVSGLTADEFLFVGFVPHKKGRETLFGKIKESKRTVVFYESPHRIMKTIESLTKYLEEDREVVVGRELTKVYEEVVRGSIQEVFAYYKNNPDKIKGEFVVAIGA